MSAIHGMMGSMKPDPLSIKGDTMNEEPQSMSMDQLLAANDAAWDRLRSLVARHPESELITAHDPAGWTSKDHLAHLAAWERGMLHVLRDGWPQWQGMGIDAALFAAMETDGYDRINEAIRQANLDRPVGDVLIELGELHDAMHAVIRGLGEAGLDRPVSDFRHDDTDLLVRRWIPGDTCDHYDEHRGYIAVILGDV